ncbi:MAG: hypothetical protein ACRD1C_04420 [Terriglobales bacterium]
MPRGLHSTAILVVVFVLGLAAGIAGMVWAWPGVHARYFNHRREHRLQSELQLTPQQVSKIQGVFKNAGNLRHQIHVQFQPQYEKLCDQFVATQREERDAYMQLPQRQQLLGKLQSIMTPSQWTKWQQMGSQNGHRPRRDPCGHLHPLAPAPAAKPSGR